MLCCWLRKAENTPRVLGGVAVLADDLAVLRAAVAAGLAQLVGHEQGPRRGDQCDGR